jgi:hypothetical protein
MNKFDQIFKTSFDQLNEASVQDPNNPTLKQAADLIGKAINNSSVVKTNANANSLANTLFGQSPDDSTNPLHSAFDKIKQNPENFNLEDHEKEAFMAIVNKINPQQKEEETPSEKPKTTSSTETGTTQSSNTSNATTTTNHQPNATQYNPLNQS